MPQGPEPEGSSVGGTSVMSQYLGYAATMPDLAVWYRWAEASMPMGIVAKRPTPQAITPTNAISPQTNVPINIGPFVVIWIDNGRDRRWAHVWDLGGQIEGDRLAFGCPERHRPQRQPNEGGDHARDAVDQALQDNGKGSAWLVENIVIEHAVNDRHKDEVDDEGDDERRQRDH